MLSVTHNCVVCRGTTISAGKRNLTFRLLRMSKDIGMILILLKSKVYSMKVVLETRNGFIRRLKSSVSSDYAFDFRAK